MSHEGMQREMAVHLTSEHKARLMAGGAIISIVILLAASVILGFYLPITRDEVHHWPVALLFGGGLPSIEVLASYRAGPGPLSYLIWGNLHAIGAELWLLRTTSMMFLILAAAGLIRLARSLQASSTAIMLAFIVLQPYVFINGFLLLTDALALALAAWALCWVLEGVKTGHAKYWMLSGVAIAALLYTRQPYVVIPVGLALTALLRKQWRTEAFATAALSLAAFGPLFALWGGFSTLTVQRSTAWKPEHFNHLLAWLSFFFWPYLLTRAKWTKPQSGLLWLVPAACLGLLTAGFLPASRLRGAGVMDHLVLLTGRLGPDWLPYGLYGILWAGGAVITSHVAFEGWSNPVRRPFLIMAVCAAGLPAICPIWWERHFIPAYLLVGILAWTEPLRRRWIAIGWLVIVGLLTMTHLGDVVAEGLWNTEVIGLLLEGLGG
ncbi:MAG: glycosyltransferase family 39 protein [Armatimonadota bacterium]|nr:glycosyltransferase family 39 protein [Armatimonadota bacterium]